METYGSLATVANFTNEYLISSGRSHILDSDLSSLLAMSRQDDQQSQLLTPQSQASQSISRGMYNPRLHEVPRSIDEIRYVMESQMVYGSFSNLFVFCWFSHL